MKFTCEKKDIINIIAAASRILPLKGLNAEASAMLISTQNNGVQFECTDSHTRMRSLCPAVIESEGKCMVQAHTLRNILSTYSDGKIEFEMEGGSLWMRSGKAKSKFQLLDTSLFPGAGLDENIKCEVKISQSALKAMLEATNYAAGADPTKPVLSGIVLTLGGGKIQAMGIDGYRMSVMSEKIDAETEGKYILNIKGVREIIHHLKDEGDVAIKFHETNRVSFEMGSVSLTCSLLEGTPLNAENIFPKEKKTAIKVKCDELIASVNRASIVSGSKPVKLTIDKNLASHFIRVRSQSETGECDEEIAIEMTGKPLDIKFNPVYLMDALKHIKRKECIMEFKDGMSPCVCVADAKASKHLILPCA